MKQSYEKQKRYYLKRMAEGWRNLSWIVPAEVYDKVYQYKNELMAEYNRKKNNENKCFNPTDATKV